MQSTNVNIYIRFCVKIRRFVSRKLVKLSDELVIRICGPINSFHITWKFTIQILQTNPNFTTQGQQNWGCRMFIFFSFLSQMKANPVPLKYLVLVQLVSTYCTRATISRGLYIFYSIFHLYFRDINITDKLFTKKLKIIYYILFN